MDSDPALTIADTTAAGEVLLEWPIGAARISTGELVVADRAASNILVFDSLGALVRRIGQRGQGPNEFRGIWWLGQCGVDSVFVWDLGLRRMTLIDRGVAIVRQYSFPPDAGQGTPFTLACSASGTFAYQPVPLNVEPVAEGTALERGVAPVHATDA